MKISGNCRRSSGRAVMDEKKEINWEETTWEGNRRLQIRRFLTLSVHQRLECLESMCDLYRHMQQLKAEGKMKYG